MLECSFCTAQEFSPTRPGGALLGLRPYPGKGTLMKTQEEILTARPSKPEALEANCSILSLFFFFPFTPLDFGEPHSVQQKKRAPDILH